MDYFDEERKAAWRAARPHLPDPEVWMRDATAEDGCPSAHTAFATARRAGWSAILTYARGTVADDEGFPMFHTLLVPLVNEGGEPVLTKTGKQANREEKTDRPIVVESIVLRVHAPDPYRWVRACWERVAHQKPAANWKFQRAWTHKRRLSSNEMTTMLKEGPCP